MTFRKQYLLTLSWILFLMLLALLTPNPANAQRIEFSAGHTRYHATDGVWYDSLSGGYDNRLTPQSWILSLRSLGYKVSLVNLGDSSNNAQWGAYEHGDELADPSLSRASVMGGKGSGRIYGLSLAKTFEHNFGNLNLGVEAGPFIYHTEWHEVFWPLSDPSKLGRDDTTHNNFTLYAGATARYKYFFIEGRYYGRILDGLIGRHATQVTAGISFPFGGEK